MVYFDLNTMTNRIDAKWALFLTKKITMNKTSGGTTAVVTFHEHYSKKRRKNKTSGCTTAGCLGDILLNCKFLDLSADN